MSTKTKPKTHPTKKLALRTETVRALSHDELAAAGGAGFEIPTPFTTGHLPTRLLSAAGCPAPTTAPYTISAGTSLITVLSR
jgi:hypothetical protein